MPKHILSLTRKEKEEFLSSFKTVFNDCDGVIWFLGVPFENAGAALSLLQKAGKSLKFVTNNSLNKDEIYMKRLSDIGVKNITPKDIIYPLKTTVAFLKSNPKYKHIYPLCGPHFKNALRDNGFTVDDEAMHDEVEEAYTMELFGQLILPSKPVDAIVIDLDLNLTIFKCSKALVYAMSYPDCDIIVGVSDPNMVFEQGITIPTPKCAADYMAKRAGKELIVLGKPGEHMAQVIKELYDITKPEENLFVGDTLAVDIKLGNLMGFQTLFVLSGVDSYEDMMNASDENKPTYYADSVADFVKLFESLNENSL